MSLPLDDPSETPAPPARPVRKPRTIKREPLVQPFLKWAGGKRQLLPEIRTRIPKKYNNYFEPFLGGGAVLFDLQPSPPKQVTVNDFNEELINLYEVIKATPEELIQVASAHPNTSEHFYEVREQDRSEKFGLLTPVQRAARIIYLNKTCFNGLFRVNSQGQFNVPFGNYTNPVIAEPAVIHAVSRYLNAAKVEFLCGDFEAAVGNASKNDFVYFDPPYDPVSDTAAFTGYAMNGFDREEQVRLKLLCDRLTERGVKVLLSNSGTPFIYDLYRAAGYSVDTVQARRNINSVSAGRGKVDEVLVRNYPA